MALKSKLFSGQARLEACAVKDSAHVVPGDRGPHVSLIQQAVNRVDGANIGTDGIYGPGTAKAVLAYKQKNKIINSSYQTQADNIVGRMTIAALDDDLVRNEKNDDVTCVYVMGSGVGRAIRGGPELAVTGAVTAPRAQTETEFRLMTSARARSIQSLETVIRIFRDLEIAIVAANLPFGRPLTDDHKKTLEIVGRWLHINPGAPVRALPTLAAAVKLMRKNINVKDSLNLPPAMRRTFGLADFGLVTGGSSGIDNGVECGNSFFDFGGPNCHRDVMTHEFFHFLDVGHGGGGPREATPRDRITTPTQALNSADNLAQMIAELVTPGGKTDACARRGE